jgi:hypothetical protein
MRLRSLQIKLKFHFLCIFSLDLYIACTYYARGSNGRRKGKILRERLFRYLKERAVMFLS